MTKKEFNDRFYRERKLLVGSEWYDIQAFRALNQALGRCIRHRSDWGAIILLDSRLENPKNISNLSKWVQKNLRIRSDVDSALESLREFIKTNEERQKIEREEMLLQQESQKYISQFDSQKDYISLLDDEEESRPLATKYMEKSSGGGVVILSSSDDEATKQEKIYLESISSIQKSEQSFLSCISCSTKICSVSSMMDCFAELKGKKLPKSFSKWYLDSAQNPSSLAFKIGVESRNMYFIADRSELDMIECKEKSKGFDTFACACSPKICKGISKKGSRRVYVAPESVSYKQTPH